MRETRLRLRHALIAALAAEPDGAESAASSAAQAGAAQAGRTASATSIGGSGGKKLHAPPARAHPSELLVAVGAAGRGGAPRVRATGSNLGPAGPIDADGAPCSAAAAAAAAAASAAVADAPPDSATGATEAASLPNSVTSASSIKLILADVAVRGSDAGMVILGSALMDDTSVSRLFRRHVLKLIGDRVIDGDIAQIRLAVSALANMSLPPLKADAAPKLAAQATMFLSGLVCGVVGRHHSRAGQRGGGGGNGGGGGSGEGGAVSSAAATTASPSTVSPTTETATATRQVTKPRFDTSSLSLLRNALEAMQNFAQKAPQSASARLGENAAFLCAALRLLAEERDDGVRIAAAAVLESAAAVRENAEILVEACDAPVFLWRAVCAGIVEPALAPIGNGDGADGLLQNPSSASSLTTSLVAPGFLLPAEARSSALRSLAHLCFHHARVSRMVLSVAGSRESWTHQVDALLALDEHPPPLWDDTSPRELLKLGAAMGLHGGRGGMVAGAAVELAWPASVSSSPRAAPHVGRHHMHGRSHSGVRVLSLDGGGARGLVAISMLREIEARTGRRVAELFDLVGGTSTGAIIGFLLTNEGKSAAEVERIYLDLFKRVFVQESFSTIRTVTAGAKYKVAHFERCLAEVLESSRLIDFSLRPRWARAFAVAAAVDTLPAETFIFRNYQHPPHGPGSRYVGSSLHTQQESLRATSAAPSFFDPYPDVHTGRLFRDGGVVANNPTAIALHEARAAFPGARPTVVLSLGTGAPPPVPVRSATGWGALANTLIYSCTDTAVIDSAVKDAGIDPGTMYVRLSPTGPAFDMELDDVRDTAIASLQVATAMYIDEVSAEIDELCARLCDDRAGWTDAACQAGEPMLFCSPGRRPSGERGVSLGSAASAAASAAAAASAVAEAAEAEAVVNGGGPNTDGDSSGSLDAAQASGDDSGDDGSDGSDGSDGDGDDRVVLVQSAAPAATTDDDDARGTRSLTGDTHPASDNPFFTATTTVDDDDDNATATADVRKHSVSDPGTALVGADQTAVSVDSHETREPGPSSRRRGTSTAERAGERPHRRDGKRRHHHHHQHHHQHPHPHRHQHQSSRGSARPPNDGTVDSNDIRGSTAAAPARSRVASMNDAASLAAPGQPGEPTKIIDPRLEATTTTAAAATEDPSISSATTSAPTWRRKFSLKRLFGYGATPAASSSTATDSADSTGATDGSTAARDEPTATATAALHSGGRKTMTSIHGSLGHHNRPPTTAAAASAAVHGSKRSSAMPAIQQSTPSGTVAVAASLATALEAERSARLREGMAHDRNVDRLTRESREKDRQIGDLLLRLHEAESRVRDAEAEIERVARLKMESSGASSIPAASNGRRSTADADTTRAAAARTAAPTIVVVAAKDAPLTKNVAQRHHDNDDGNDGDLGDGDDTDNGAADNNNDDDDDDEDDDDDDDDECPHSGDLVEDVVEIEPETGRALTATTSRPPSPRRASSVGGSSDDGDHTDTEVVNSLFDSLKRVL
jgi:hypothetical protein